MKCYNNYSKILLKSSKGKEVLVDDYFEINEKFTCAQHRYVNLLWIYCRIKINTIQLKETKEEQQKTEDSVFEHRPYIIDAGK